MKIYHSAAMKIVGIESKSLYMPETILIHVFEIIQSAGITLKYLRDFTR